MNSVPSAWPRVTNSSSSVIISSVLLNSVQITSIEVIMFTWTHQESVYARSLTQISRLFRHDQLCSQAFSFLHLAVSLASKWFLTLVEEQIGPLLGSLFQATRCRLMLFLLKLQAG